jgi:peptide deformylase
MAIREILVYNKHEAAFRKKSEPVMAVNRRIKKLIQDLRDTLRDRPEGVGLAAPQIGVHSRVILVQLGTRDEDEDVTRSVPPPTVLINPEIIEEGDEQKDFDGCLSLPGLFADTVRPHRLRVKGLDEWGKPFDQVFEGFDAVVVHHEIDHLEGILFIDRITGIEDLYRVRENEKGELVRVPITRA